MSPSITSSINAVSSSGCGSASNSTATNSGDEVAAREMLSKTTIFATSTPATAACMSYQNMVALLALLLLCGLATVNGLKCHMCGQYNEGVGSITPCLNYSDQYAHLYLKECSKKSEKFCVKYISELSTVRDCATECVEKDIWQTQTYCCNQDGCNGSSALKTSTVLLLLPPLYFIFSTVMAALKVRH